MIASVLLETQESLVTLLQPLPQGLECTVGLSHTRGCSYQSFLHASKLSCKPSSPPTGQPPTPEGTAGSRSSPSRHACSSCPWHLPLGEGPMCPHVHLRPGQGGGVLSLLPPLPSGHHLTPSHSPWDTLIIATLNPPGQFCSISINNVESFYLLTGCKSISRIM